MLKNKGFILFITLIFMLTSSSVVFAEEKTEREQKNVEQEKRATTNASFNVTDSEGNRFYVLGSCSFTGEKAHSSTSFSTTHYSEGTTVYKQKLDNTMKTIVSAGTVTMRNGVHSSTTNYTGRGGKLGASGTYSTESDTLLYSVVNISGYHSFSCNGGSKSANSSWS